MKAEEKIVDYICGTTFDDLSAGAIETVRNMLRADLGTIIAGAHADGVGELVQHYQSQGGAAEARIMVYGDKVPAHNAAMVNAVMSRALDFCDAIAPGPHIGSSIIPVALACTELRGGCDGREFFTALAIGAEIGARFNLTEQAYDGFDPTGICVPFGAVAVASRLLGLNREQTWNALGIAFNRCGGSFQSNIDGTLSVRVNQGWVAHDAVQSARFAQLGITGPQNFLEGIYGYLHLYGKNLIPADDIVGNLGTEDRSRNMVYKKYPSCGATQGMTEVILGLLHDHGLSGDDVESVSLTLNPYSFKLVGHEFVIGNNPTVDGQFSAQYCVANVLLRGNSAIRNFTVDAVRDPAIRPYIARVTVAADPGLDERGHTAMDMHIRSKDGREFHRGLDAAPGFPGNPLSAADHILRFRDCMDFAGEWFSASQADALLASIEQLENAADVTDLVSLLTPRRGSLVG
jgi:2-methylcitrate dehydratase PrpD